MPVKATDEQIKSALAEFNGVRIKAARKLKLTGRGLQLRIARMQARGIELPESEYHHCDRAEYLQRGVTGTSTLYDADGTPKLQWVKTATGKLDREQVIAITREAFGDIPPARVVPRVATGSGKSLLTVYPIGDQHVGMYAWGEEAGDDYDIKISERLLLSAVTHLVEIAPASDEALIVDVGDFLHYDTIRAETTRSHNQLDADSRYHAMIRSALRLMRACVDAALTKHRRVSVICTPGNHNDMGAAWMSEALALFYSGNARVNIYRHAGKFHYYEFGKVLLGVTHGDTGKPEKLAGVMAADQPEAWGRTLHRHWLTGHVHHRAVIEMQGVLWETFRTLAAKDAWAAAAGYRSGRDMTAIVFHKEHGEIARHRFDVSMLK